MEETYVTTADTVESVRNWCFQSTVDTGQIRQEMKDRREELNRQKKLFEREKQEFLRMKELEEEMLKKEKKLFAMKWQILEDEWRKLASERELVKRKKEFYERLEEYQTSTQEVCREQASILFCGVSDQISLKKRYKDLLKIYHPDNLSGDQNMVLKINEEYEELKKKFA